MTQGADGSVDPDLVRRLAAEPPAQYYARIYRAAAKRLGLADWQRQIDTKLASVGDMYRFVSDQARNRRDEFLELIIIFLIALELIVGVLTLVRWHA